PWLLCLVLTIAHAPFSDPRAAGRAARAARARLGVCVFLPASFELLRAAPGARRACGRARRAGAEAAFHRHPRCNARPGAGVRLAGVAPAARAAPARRVRVLRSQPARIRARARSARVFCVAQRLQPVRCVGVLELYVGHLRHPAGGAPIRHDRRRRQLRRDRRPADCGPGPPEQGAPDRQRAAPRRHRRAHPRAAEPPPEAPLGGSILAGARAALTSPFLLAICGYLLCYTALSTALYFQQVEIVRDAVPDPQERTRLFASVDLAVNGLTLAIQVLAFSRLAAFLGPAGMLAAVPVLSVAGFVWLGATPPLTALIAFGVIRR